MADTKISNLTALAEAPAVGDLLAIVDVSASETKKITTAYLFTSPAFTTQISTPAIVTASGALTVTPAAGSGVNIVLSTIGDFAVNTDDLYVDTSAGKVGVGTTTPEDLLTVSGGNLQIAHTTPRIYINDTDAAADEGEYFFQSAAGVLTGYAINDARGALSQWLGVTRSGVTVATVYFPTGTVLVGTSTSSGKLTVSQASTTAAIPALYINQADVSEQMIEFATTIGTGNAIEAIGSKTLTTTHFIKVTLPGSLTRYIPCGTIA